MTSRYDTLIDALELHSHRGFAVGIAFVNGTPNKRDFTYPPGFLRQYEAEGLIAHDHTIRAGLSADGVFTWSGLEATYGPSRAVVAARSYGMVEGVCWAVTVNGMKSIGSISLDCPLTDVQIPIEEITGLFQLATIEAANEIAGTALSQRSREYLSLVARGLRVADIAAEIGISVPGVRKRQAVALQELGAKNVQHAVAIAISTGGITSYQLV